MHWIAWDKLAIPKNQGGMGFRDMQAFNVALLGKQAWRLITNPNSLCAQVLQTRYYHNCNFMEANAPRATSRTWRAILVGRDALKIGLIKRVGSGETISIWHDSWIPGSASMKPMGRLQNDDDVIMVNELITADYQWNVTRIRELFFAPDADAIIGIPLRHNGGEDFLAWAHEKSGIYSVRSAYRAIVAKGQADDMARSDAPPSSSTTDVWKRLWKLCVIPKVRVFWWRVLRGILPDYGTLTWRHVMVDSTCGICKAKSESMFHALIECSHAQMF
jgi:hypothetical protein